MDRIRISFAHWLTRMAVKAMPECRVKISLMMALNQHWDGLEMYATFLRECHPETRLKSRTKSDGALPMGSKENETSKELVMAWDETTNFEKLGYKSFTCFRVLRNVGCVLMWKPSMFGVAFEKYKHGGAIHLGPFTAGFGRVDQDRPMLAKYPTSI